jgi:hypothetical protein
VPRQYVHKAALAEVLLTGWQPAGEDSFTITAQWPRAHSFYTSSDGRHDPLLFAETVRQIFPLLSHVAYDVPLGHHLIWDRFRYAVAAAALRIEPRPAEVTLRVDCFDVVRRRGRVAAVSLHVEALRDGGVRLGTADARFTSHAPAVYRRLRGPHASPSPLAVPLPPPVPAAHVGHERLQNVVLSATDSARRWQLRADTAHPVLFDHPVDHIPGALLLETARQAAHAVARPARAVPVGMSATFSRFAELDAPCWVEATTAPGGGPVRVTVSQHGHEVFAAEVTPEAAPELDRAPRQVAQAGPAAARSTRAAPPPLARATRSN